MNASFFGRIQIQTSIFGLVILSMLLLGCQAAATKATRIRVTITRSSAELPTTTPIPLAEPLMPTSIPTIGPMEIPTSEPLLPIFLSVPEFLTSAVTDALEQYDNEIGSRQIILYSDEAAADFQLVPGTSDVPAGSRAVALTVPFTSEMQSITREEATQLLTTGHPIVEAIDWSEMLPHRKALKVDGLLPFQAGYPMLIDWSFEVNSDSREIAIELAPYIAAELNDFGVIQLSAVGDIMLDRALGYAIEQGNIEFPFSSVVEQLSSADITVGNLESALGDVGIPADKSYTFQAPPEAAESLAYAGFDIVSLANNHALDYGIEALEQATELLTNQSIAAIGAGPNDSAARSPHVREVQGIKLAFLAYTDVPVEVRGFDTRQWQAGENQAGLLWADLSIVEEDVKIARELADVVIIVLHSGYEYIEAPSPQHSTSSRAALEAGADIVIGHHAHLLQGVEFNERGVIVYGLGNFAFEIDGPPDTAILNVWMDQQGVRQIEFVPAIVQFGGQPRIANDLEKSRILDHIYRLTDALN